VGTISAQVKDYIIAICCFFVEHVALKGKSKKDLLTPSPLLSKDLLTPSPL
jgi:hypothetical protein